MVDQKKYATIGLATGANIEVFPQTITVKTISGLKSKNKDILRLSNLSVEPQSVRIANKFEICNNVLLLKTFDRRFLLVKTTDVCSNPKFSISAEPIGENKFFFDNNRIAMLLSNDKRRNYRTCSFATKKERIFIELFRISKINFVSCQYAYI